MTTSTDETVETAYVDGGWVVHVDAVVLGRYDARRAAVEAGASLALTFGLPHVVRYSSRSLPRGGPGRRSSADLVSA